MTFLACVRVPLTLKYIHLPIRQPINFYLNWKFIMKKILTATMLAITSAFCVNASAQSTNTGNVNVTVTLTPKCVINSTATGTAATITAIAMTYNSFQSTASNGNTSFTVRCAEGLPYTPTINNVPGLSSGISYFTSLGLASATGITADSLALASQTGTAGGTTLHINTTAGANQAGSITASTQARVVTLTF